MSGSSAGQTTVMPRNLNLFSSYRYPVSASLVPQGGTEATALVLDASVTGVRILKDYDRHIYPYYAISLLLSVNDYRTLQSIWRTGLLYLTIGKNTLPIGGATNNETVGPVPYLDNVELQVLTAPSTPDGIPDQQDDAQALTTQRIGAQIECVPTSSMAVNKSLNDTSYHGAAPTDMVAHLASKNAPQGYMFSMAPADNLAQIETAHLPPLHFADAVRYVDEVHGLYTGNLHVFLDHDQGYILSSTKTIAPPQGKPTLVTLQLGNLPSATSELTVGSGYDPSSMSILLRTSTPIDLDLKGPASQESDGEVLKLVNSSQNAPFSSDIQDVTASGQTLSATPKQRVLWQGYDNPMSASKIAASTRENYAPTSLVFYDVDLDAFQVTLPWTLQVGQQSQAPVAGDWRLSAVEILLTRAAATIGSCSCQVLARIRPSSAGAVPS
jgi:hypothetical protein